MMVPRQQKRGKGMGKLNKRFSFLIFLGILIVLVIVAIAAFQGQAADPVELVDQRSRNSKTFSLGGDSYALDVSLGSVHYKDDPGDPNEQWKDIDTTITESPRENWDWETVKGNWHLLIRDDTTVAVGKAGGWLGFQYIGFAYLDWASKEYRILDTRQPVIPVVTNNKITWTGIFGGATLEYIYTPDGFKENLYIPQTTRDWLAAHPPSSYGLDNDTSYLTGIILCDWTGSFPAETADGTPVNWDNVNEFIGSGVFWRHPVTSKIVTALPVGYARHDDVEPEDWIDLRCRFFSQGGFHYLLFGAKVTDLNSMPAGTIILDPSVDEQVGASSDDCYARQGDSYFSLTSVNFPAGDISSSLYDAEAGGRFTGVAIPQGSTITDAWISLRARAMLSNIPDTFIEVEDTDDAATFTDLTNYNARSRTSAVSWTPPSWITDNWYNSNSIVTPIQAVINRGGWSSGNDLVVFWRDEPGWGFLQAYIMAHSYDSDSGSAPKLHIEYTAAAAAAGYSWGEVIGG